MSDLPTKDPDKYCNARKTDGSGYCQHTAGWGTDHTGHGRCKYHGGSTPNQEKKIVEDLEDAASEAAVSFRLQLKHFRKKLERGEYEDIDWQALDRMGRTAFDRTGVGPEESHDVDVDATTDVTAEFISFTEDDGDE